MFEKPSIAYQPAFNIFLIFVGIAAFLLFYFVFDANILISLLFFFAITSNAIINLKEIHRNKRKQT